ncbi:MAG: ATP-grasp domain-containing protein [Desulfobacterales bacterium]|jgi:ribosomal protein S6--L-glutamate ligase|nr:ATP-grasp domain-containing protein [Desulfobacterales bacterium]
MNDFKKVIALESRLRHCPNVMTLGVRPNFSDYSSQEAQLIQGADRIYYPSSYYADMFETMGKKIFPSPNTYRFAQNKIKQTLLFQLMGIPTPRTRTFYGVKKEQKIISNFSYPFVAKIPRGSALGMGVFLIQNSDELHAYCKLTRTAYIQEYLPIQRDIRVVIIGDEFFHAYWRVAPAGDFRCNIAIGARIEFNDIPPEAIRLARHTAACCRWDDVGIDVCEYDGRFYVIEANMKYGREGFRQAGIDYAALMEKLIGDGAI